MRCEFLLQQGCTVNHMDTGLQTAIFYSARNGPWLRIIGIMGAPWQLSQVAKYMPLATMPGILLPIHNKFSTLCWSFDPIYAYPFGFKLRTQDWFLNQGGTWTQNSGVLNSFFWTKMSATDVFLKRGADVEIKDKRGFTPIFWAAESGRVDMMRLT